MREVLTQPKRVALLAFLALEGRVSPVSRDRILALFWPESDAARARNALSQSLHHLRQALGADVIESHGANAVAVHPEALWCDAVVFSDAIERGEPELALDLYRGEFCPTLFVSGAPGAEEWVETERRRLRARALTTARTLSERLVSRGDADAAARTARRALSLHPDDESDVRALLALLDRAGDLSGALLAYKDYARRLADELETEPAPETRRLVEGMRRRAEPPEPEESANPAGAAHAGRLDAGTAGTDERPGRDATTEASSATATPTPAMTTAGRGRRGRRVAASIAAVLVLMVLAVLAIRLRQPPVTEQPGHVLAVFPFTVRGSAGLAYLSEGMADLLSAKLDGSSGLHATDPRSVVAAVAAAGSQGAPSAAVADRLARGLGAGWFITGDVVEIAGHLQIRGALFEQQAAQPAASATVTGDTTTLFELVDELAGRLLVGLGGGRDTSLTRLASVTTHSLPALKAFLVGEQAMRAGRDAAAADAFLEAVSLDTTFALAQYRLAVSSTWIAVPGVTDNAVIAAMAAAAARHAEHLTPLVRDLLSAYAAYKAVRTDEAERRYRRIAESHPDNVEAWFMLGETWFHYNSVRGRSPHEAREAFERVLALDPSNAHAMLHLARLAALEGRTTELDSLGRAYLARYRDAERTLEMRTLLAALHDDPVEHRAIAREAIGADGLVLVSVLQAALVYAQDLDLSRALVPSLQRAMEPMKDRVMGSLLSDLELSAGRWSRQSALDLAGASLSDDWLLESRALLAACRAVPVPRGYVAALRDTIAAMRPFPSVNRPGLGARSAHGDAMQAYLVGLLSARLGDTAHVRAQLAVLGATRESEGDAVANALSHTLRAELARAAGDPARARVELQQFPLDPVLGVGHWGAHERFLMAELLRDEGRNEEALEWYLSFPAGFDQPWVAPAHLRAAQLYARLGNTEQARFHYGRFIRLWADADAEFQPVVTQAREALARLRSQ